VDEACSWLRAQDAEAARVGWASIGEFPFAVDDYGTLPPFILRQSPAYYHALLKDAGFETEKGMVDYRAEARPDLLARWESAVEAATRAGYELVALEDVPAQTRARDFGTAWNEAFHNHWGAVAFTEQEFGSLFSLQEPLGTLAYSLIAYRDSEPAGVVWVTPDPTALAQRAPGREIRPEERVNTLGIGVRAPHRGRGVNMALASSAFLALAKRGQTYMSYTLVLDDNRPSRRTAEKLGASVCANYVAYRRNFQTRRQRRRHQ
jgi:GNAT superfamily N-acetyltransferase